MQKYLIISTYRAFILFFFNTFALDFYNRDIIVLNIITKRTNALKTRNVIAGKILVGLLLLAAVQTTKAQSGTNSPYSQFGLGQLSEQSSGFNRGMDGLALGFHEHNQINYLNPASYSALDSLSFIFDIGASGQVTNFKENGVKKNAKNADFEYIVAGFRVLPHFGLSFGFLPYTNVGYSYSSSSTLNNSSSTTSTDSYDGSGGIHQVYLGLGWSPFKGFSIGVNGGYLYGDYSRSLVNSFSNSYINRISKIETADVESYMLNFGAQYTARLTKKDELTLGLAYTPGHKIGGKPELDVISSNTSTSVSDTTVYNGSNLKLEIPTSYGIGLMYNHNNQLKVGADYTLQRWGKVSEPTYSSAGGVISYAMASGQYKDRHKVTVGAEYCPGEYSRHFLKRVHYRAGVSYATPYYYINGHDGPKEMSASLGFGIPIMNSWNNRSILNISGSWVRRSAANFITENTFRINIGLTFNERWFAKWKVQ